MRLINANTLRFENFFEKPPPAYLILSHTWGEDEVAFRDMQQPHLHLGKSGHAKITQTCQLARDKAIDYVWIDTCCIDKSSSAELTESINSMFQWYQRAVVCVVHLADMESGVDFGTGVRFSRWITRGWTLQELIAPKRVEFYDSKWKLCGQKHRDSDALSAATRIPEDLLLGNHRSSEYSVAQRLSWASSRTTTRVEDEAYCLFGILEVNMPLIYGEGKMAFRRLQEELIKRSNDITIFAWQPTREEVQEGHCGVLAASPQAFAQCEHVCVWRPSTSHNPQFVLTNRGIQLQDIFFHRIPLKNDQPASSNENLKREYVFMVGFHSRGSGVYLGIQLRKIGASLFLRKSRPLKIISSKENTSLLKTDIATCHFVTDTRPLDNDTLLGFRKRCTEVSIPGWGLKHTIPSGYWDDQDMIQFHLPSYLVAAFLLEGDVGGQPTRFTVLCRRQGEDRVQINIMETAKHSAATAYIFRRRAPGDMLHWEDLGLDHPQVLETSHQAQVMIDQKQFTVTASLPTKALDFFGGTKIGRSLQLEVVESVSKGSPGAQGREPVPHNQGRTNRRYRSSGETFPHISNTSLPRSMPGFRPPPL
ncbi:heterokaryon incompatibility protein-domain-containing protein [Cercophora samala]|uniref:Heterokaryon incompatibility protein-domain-containing protein n=1 Tax=Cercophora samala TaxID=330535 RepID=A0AA39ZBP9_9PEZI|nr:heterokaryon incompatibility protein-domain-containing protein [Cercophora samala]